MQYNYESEFESASIGTKYWAAIHILGESDDPGVWCFLSALYDGMRVIKRSDSRDDNHFAEVARVGYKAAAAIMNNVGFDPTDELHASIWNWIVNGTESENAQLAAGAIYSLESIGIPPDCVREHLLTLMDRPSRSHLGKTGTCRAVAFRVLLRLDEPLARLNIHSDAYIEFREMVYSLQREMKYPSDVDRKKQIEAECEWLKTVG